MVLPVLILIILGILYFGRYEDYSNQMTQLAESGARSASVNFIPTGYSNNLEGYIQSQAQGELANGSSDVTTPIVAYIYYPTTAPSGNTVGNAIRVCVVATVKYPFLGTNGLTSTVVEYATQRIEVADTTSFTADTPPSGCPTA